MSIDYKEEMVKFSIIVPIYKGNQYIGNIIKMAGENYSYMRSRNIECRFEILFVNDYPQEKLARVDEDIDGIEIKWIETDVNRGIHGARCYGLELSSGAYVLFFDQDDLIKSSFFYSQWENIDGFDAVVCNGVNHKRKMIYNSREDQKRVINKAVYLQKDNPIVSPGQVLIRRKAIPVEWTKYIIRNNGADDFFLWLLLLFHNAKINLNFNNLYVHTIHGGNTSRNAELMDASRKEMFSYIKKCRKIDFWSRRKLQKIIMK